MRRLTDFCYIPVLLVVWNDDRRANLGQAVYVYDGCGIVICWDVVTVCVCVCARVCICITCRPQTKKSSQKKNRRIIKVSARTSPAESSPSAAMVQSLDGKGRIMDGG